jgi:hypothetical protein
MASVADPARAEWYESQGLNVICGTRIAISLFEKSGRLCGVHSFATPGAGRLDEGSLPSIVGTITGPSATVTVTSGRAEPQVTRPVQLTRSREQVHWKSLTDDVSGDALLPTNVRLNRAAKSVIVPEPSNQACEAVD